MRQKIAFIALFLSCILNAQTRNFYVSPTGSGTLYTKASPGRVQAATLLTNPGDNVIFLDGQYQDNTNGLAFLRIMRSGTDGNPITYKKEPGTNPRIKFNVANGILVDGASWIIIDGLTVIGASNDPDVTLADALEQRGAKCPDNDPARSNPNKYNGNGINIQKRKNLAGEGLDNGDTGTINSTNTNFSHHIIVRNCSVSYCGSSGINALFADYVTFEYNEVFNNCWYSVYGGSGINMYHNWNSDNNTTDFKMIVRGNRVYGNKLQVPWGCLGYTDGNGIIYDDNKNSQTRAFRPLNTSNTNPTATELAYKGKALFENNVSYENGGKGIHAFWSDYVTIRNNTAYNNGETYLVKPGVLNNEGEITVIGKDLDFSKDCSVYNNIMYARTGERINTVYNVSNYVQENNLFFNGYTYNTTGNTDIIGLEPGFTNLAARNFTLTSSSPAINAGTDGVGKFSPNDNLNNVRPFGSSKPDIGAYEFQALTATPPAIPVILDSNLPNIFVTRVGDGTTPLSNTAYAPVTLLELDPRGGAPIRTIPLATTGTNILTVPGSVGFAGQISLSGNGQFLSMIGFDRDIATTYAASDPKVIARIGADGIVDYSTKTTSTTAVTNAVTLDGSRFWHSGSSNALVTKTFGTSTAPTSLNTTAGPSRAAGIFNNQLFGLRAFNDIVAYGSGLPTTTTTATNVVHLSTSLSAGGFVFFDLDPTISWNNTGLDVVYVSNVNSGLEKYYFDGVKWLAANSENHLKATITNQGSGYTSAPTISFAPNWVSGTNYANGAQVTSMVSGTPRLYTSNGTNPSNITQPTHTSSTVTNGWTYVNILPTLTPVVSGGKITDILIDQGAEFTLPALIISGGGGTGFAATASFPTYPNTAFNLGFNGISQMAGTLNSDGNPVIYAIRGNGTTNGGTTTAVDTNNLIVLTDMSGRTHAMEAGDVSESVIATPGLNYAFRGIAFAPNQNANVWSGKISSAFGNPSNWLGQNVPLTNTPITIPAVTPKTLQITANTTINGGVIQPGASININNGIVLTNNAPLRLRSTSVGTASIVSNTTISNVIIERYLNNQRGWRLLSNPLSTAPTFATVASTSTTPFDFVNNDAKSYNSGTGVWTNLSTTSTWASNTANSIFIKGIAGQGVGSDPSNVTVSLTGTASNAQPAAITTTAGRFYLVSNPYTSQVSVKDILDGSTGLSATIAYYDPNLATANVRVNAGGYLAKTINATTKGDANDVIIPSMGAFFVQALTNGALNIPNTSRFSGPVAFDAAGLTNKTVESQTSSNLSGAVLKVNINSAGVLFDTFTLKFKNTSDPASKIDFEKLNNDVLSLAPVKTTKSFAVSEFNLANQDIPLNFATSNLQNYTINIPVNTLSSGFVATLVDNFTSTTTTLTQGVNYNLTVNSVAASQGNNRFVIRIRNISARSMSMLSVDDTILDSKIELWPNPAREYFNFSTGKNDKIYSVTVYSLSGQKVFSKELASDSKIDTVSLPKGVYFVTISDGNDQTVKKIVVE